MVVLAPTSRITASQGHVRPVGPGGYPVDRWRNPVSARNPPTARPTLPVSPVGAMEVRRDTVGLDGPSGAVPGVRKAGLG